MPDANVDVPRAVFSRARSSSTSAVARARWKARDAMLSMTVRAHVSSAVGLLAQADSFARPAGVVVARVATPAATVPHCTARLLETDSRSASLPKTFPILGIVSGGSEEA